MKNLTEREVALIRYLRQEKNVKYEALAKRFDTTVGNVSAIVNYRTWKGVQPTRTYNHVNGRETMLIRRLAREGGTLRSIAAVVGRSPATIHGVLNA